MADLRRVDRDSEDGRLGVLELFELPPTQIAVRETRVHQFFPVNPVANDPITFNIPENPGLLDVHNCYLHSTFKITRENGGDIQCDVADGAAGQARDWCAPINNIGETYWGQVKVYAMGREFSDITDYHYKAMFDTLLGTELVERQTKMRASLFVEDTPGTKAENVAAVAAGTPLIMDTITNAGAVAREVVGHNSAEFETICRLRVDAFNQEKPFPHLMALRIVLHKNSNQKVLVSDRNHNYKLVLTACRLTVPAIMVPDALTLRYEDALAKKNLVIKIPIRRTELLTRPLAAGIVEMQETSIHTGQLPRRVMMAMVSSAAYHGSYTLNPFNFQTFDLETIQLTAAGVDYPPQPLRCDFQHNRYVEAYQQMYSAMKSNKTDWLNNGITYDAFQNGYAFFCFDLSPDASGGSGYFQLIKKGSLELKIKFRVQLPEAVQLLVYMEFDNVLSIDRFRNTHMDFTA